MPNIVQMYDVIYNEMVDAGISEPLDRPIFTDIHGIEVGEADAFGKEQDTMIKNAHYLLFADETGCNTSQKKDDMLVVKG